MKILYCAFKYDYGKPERGYSFEHYNFYQSLVEMNSGAHEIVYFPIDEILRKHGQQGMNDLLIETTKKEKPNLCFFLLFSDEIKPETIKKITESGITTFNWFADDHWRFDTYSKYYAPSFSFVSTTDSHAPKKYEKNGYRDVIKTQWACNHFLYKPNTAVPPAVYEHDVSFVGQSHGNRQHIASTLQQAGINTECWGGGWPNGKVSQDTMMDIFTRSKINLNLTKGSGFLSPKAIARIFMSRQNGKIRPASPTRWPENIKTFAGHQRDQIKGRTFEIPGCAGFLLTSHADNLEDYYVDGKEIVVFKNTNDLVDKIHYYLENPKEREEIAMAGYTRTLREHTYEQRFNQIFHHMGLN